MELSQWHARLHEHFKQLCAQRQSHPAKPPVFALEHGLSPSEVQEIRQRLQAHIKRTVPSDSHRLPWIVYATELGYGYEGDEYWQTFEHDTPGWQTYGDRHWIKRVFMAFHKQYCAARPTGEWAEHFSIIAWPIHHAILPRYLQTHLAKLLHDNKYAITGPLLRDSRQLGEFLHRESTFLSTRLYAFTEQTELAGRFASALLLHKTEQGTGLLLPQSFERLVHDLESQSQSRVWINAAQDQARRAILSGLSSGAGSGARDGHHGDSREKREPAVAGKRVPPALKGRIVLVPRSETEFEFHLDLPDFTQLVPDHAHLGELIANSRCTVAGTAGRPRPSGWLLDGPRHVVLQHLPKRDEPLLKFGDADVSLQQLFRTDELLHWEQPWLLKIGADGCAYSVRSRNVRPGQSYVLLYEHETLPPGAGMIRARVNCTGVSAWRLSVPQPMPPEFEKLLNQLSLNPWRTVHFWPAGLPAPQWDGEGFAEWLSTDPVWIGVRSDHTIRAVTFSLDEDFGSRFALRPPDPDKPVYLELPALTLGAHRLSAVVTPLDGSCGEQHGSLDIWIRTPQVKQTARKRLLSLTVDPPAAGFQDLWENRVQVSVTGPFALEAVVSINLLGPGQSDPLATATFSVRLPVVPQDWKNQFDDHVRGLRKFEENCEDANRITIGVQAAGVNKVVRVFERPLQPLRWKTSSTRPPYTIRLISHFGEGVEPTVSYYPLEAPDSPQAVAYLLATAGLATPVPGLYHAAGLGEQSAVLVPKQVARIQDFAVTLAFRQYPKSQEGVDGLLCIIERWHAARVLGELPAFGHRRQVLEGLVGRLFDCIAGEPMAAKVLAQASSQGNCRDAHLHFLTRSLKCSSLAQGLIDEHKNQAEAGAQARLQAFRRVLMRKACSGMSWTPAEEPLFEFALRLASAPETVRHWRKAEFQPYLRELMRVPTLAIAARIWVLLLAQLNRTPLGASALYAGWDWV